tara:strand:+ start:1541 stop:1927 length:387 start_codon:yes stop_codon:yes gene_type:complete
MFQRKQKRFRRRQNSRNNPSRMNGGPQVSHRTNSFTNGQSRNNFRSLLSPEKSFEKYTALAKEAMSSGDKTLSENYLQHADHFMRIIEDRNRIRNQNKTIVAEKPLAGENTSSENSMAKQEQQVKNEE